MFLRSRNSLLTFLQSYHVWVTSKIQVNFRFNRHSKVLIITVSHRFSSFFIIYVLEVEESISDIPSELPCLGNLENPSQLSVQENLRGTDDFVLWIFTISSIFMFSRSRNTFLTFLLGYHVCVTSSIQVNFRFNRFSEVLMIVSFGFSQYFHYICFQGQRIICWHFYWATMLGGPRKSETTSGSEGFWGLP